MNTTMDTGDLLVIKNTMRYFILMFNVLAIFICAGVVWGGLINISAHAQTPQQSDADAPIEITADGTLEWRRAQNTFIARKNAMAKQGATSIAAQTLRAAYTDGTGGKFDITKITADGSVTLKNADAVLRGDTAVYDITAQNAVLTGQDLSLKTASETLNADDEFTYNMAKNTLTARGNARLTQVNENGETTTLRAGTIDATLSDNGAGTRTLKTLTAKTDIRITTPTETITGQYGVYDAQNKTAQLSGGVTIKRGKNILQGARADVDFNTNISRIHGAKNSGGAGDKNTGRVRGIFYPKSTN